MFRPRRHLLQSYSFHITLCCNSRQFVIAKGLRRDELLPVLKRAQEKVPHRMHGVCLMPNHLHLLLRADDATQVDVLDWLDFSDGSQPPALLKYINANTNAAGTWMA
jgi:putative transposase